MPARTLLNGLLIGSAAFWVLGSIVNIDASHFKAGAGYFELLSHYDYDVTTHPYLAQWASYEWRLEEHPILTKTFINTVNYMLGDALAQVLAGTKLLDLDPKRVLRNGAIGAAFGPLTHAYYEFSDVILPPVDVANVPWKIGMDQSIYAATKYSLYLSAVGLLSGLTPREVTADVEEKIWPTMKTGWRFWPAAHLITYTLIPPRHRVLWVNGLDLVWITVLSTLAQGGGAEGGADGVDGADGEVEGGGS